MDEALSCTWQGLFQAMPHGAVLLREREAGTPGPRPNIGRAQDKRSASGVRDGSPKGSNEVRHESPFQPTKKAPISEGFSILLVFIR